MSDSATQSERIRAHLLPALQRLLFSIPAHDPETATIRKKMGRTINKDADLQAYEVGGTVNIEAIHFQLMWAIDEFCKTGKCDRPHLERIFLKKYPGQRSEFLRAITDLEAVGYVCQEENQRRRSAKILNLTVDGNKSFQKKVKLRSKAITAFLSPLEKLNNERLTTFTDILDEISMASWANICSKEQTVPNSKRNVQNRPKK